MRWLHERLDLYYGWIIVAVSLVSMAHWFGIRASFSIFYVALLEDFGWSRGEAAGVQSMALIVYTILAPMVGGLIDRFGPRRVIAPGILVLVLGLLLCSQMNTLMQFYLFYGLLVAGGVTCIAIVSYSAILAHWFQRKRGTANGIAVSGMGLGTFLFAVASQHLIAVWGWRVAFVLLGGLVLAALLPLNLLLLRHKPGELGLLPDGLDREEPVRETRSWEVVDRAWSETHWTIGRAVRVSRFWALLAFPFFVTTGTYIVLVHHVRFLVDLGMDPMNAAYVLAIVGIISSIFRVFWGWLSDRIGRERTYTLGVSALVVGICSLILLERTHAIPFVYLFVFFFGMGWGVTAPMFMSTAADLFQGRTFGLIYGIVEGALGAGGALGAWFAGFLFDQTQTYRWAFGLAGMVAVVSCGLIWLAAPRKVRRVLKRDR